MTKFVPINLSLRALTQGFTAVILALMMSLSASAKNGFDLSISSIPINEIHRGGPPKDGIPAIDQPKFIRAEQQALLQPEDRVLGLNLDDVARAYPIAILNWHEVVNDHSQATPVAITFCPLCGTGMAFLAGNAKQPEFFGVSGLLFQSDVLLYDRSTESLWSQIMSEAVVGKQTGTRLKQLPLAHTTWKNWLANHPDTLVLSTDTQVRRDYARDPYSGYEQSRQLYFDVRHNPPPPYHPKERVLGFRDKERSIAFPYSELSKQGESKFEYAWRDRKLIVHWDEESDYAEIRTEEGKLLTSTLAFWFAWYTFHPQGEVFKARN